MAAESETPPASEAEKEVVFWWNDLSRRFLSTEVDHPVEALDSNAFFKCYRCSSAQRLSGGFVNFVCRAFLETATNPSVSSQHDAMPFVHHGVTYATVIVKRFSSSIHNSCSYEIERTALWLCNSMPRPSSASELAISVRVPRLLAFDDATRTIVMEDAGTNAKMLSEWLLHVAVQANHGMSSRQEGASADVAAGWPELTADKFAKAVAATFVKNRAACRAARLLPSSSDIDIGSTSSPFNLQLRPPASFSEQLQWYSHFSAQALAFGVPAPIVEALSPALSNTDVPAADASVKGSVWRRRADAVHDGWDWSVALASESSVTNSSDASVDSSECSTSPTSAADSFSPADLSLIVGDLWPNSVLIDPVQRTLWIVDWEAAQIGHSGRDVALLIDHLWIMTQNPAKYDTVRAKKLICSFTSVFCPTLSGGTGAPAGVVDWRLGREPEFLRSVAMFAGSPHYGIDHSSALRCALDEISALSSIGILQ
jgi:hypothetical protein